MLGTPAIKTEESKKRTATEQFSSLFEELGGYPPLRWQVRLFELMRFAPWEEWPDYLDLPTGLGKTSVIHIWLAALTQQLSEGTRRLPLRLVYVVDRRTVVDQATRITEAIKGKIDDHPSLLGWPLGVSTLRGQFADNREWTWDMSRPAIVIGTVDLLGSRLLFSGYRSSYKMRPLDAGLLGQDSLVILDEAHLSEPFAKLTWSIEQLNRSSLFPIKVLHMSATGNAFGKKPFKLEESDLQGDRDTNPVIRRFEAQKRLTLHENVSDQPGEIVKKTAELAADNSRVIAFVRSPDIAAKIAKAVQAYGVKNQHKFKASVALLTGTIRGLERDELLRKPDQENQYQRRVMQRFLRPANRPEEGPAILISTSAGEVGFDLNADHLVCDAVPLDSLVQRLGRVNRRGDAEAEVHIFAENLVAKKQESRKSKQSYRSAVMATITALKKLPQITQDGHATYDVSPKALAPLLKETAAFAPKPATLEITDVLLDAWSMTTIVERMPGRPAVGPWLRGIEEQAPQTTFAWRAELDLDGFQQLNEESIEEWFDAHRILPHETVTAPTTTASVWLQKRWAKLAENPQADIEQKFCLIDRNGIKASRLSDLVRELEIGAHSIEDADIILPASFGGIERGVGTLDENAPASDTTEAKQDISRTLRAADVADDNPYVFRERHRKLHTVEENNSTEVMLSGEIPKNEDRLSRFALDLSHTGDFRQQLISLVRKRERPEFGSSCQTLAAHVSLVAKNASLMAKRLAIPEQFRAAFLLAADWHDKGKARQIWQRAVGAQPNQEPIGKSGGSMRHIAGGYRHEFGSLSEFALAHGQSFDPNIFDLAMHLIATHHGRGRPHFPKGGFDPEARAESPRTAIDALRRFARLQRRYGYWQLAWLENLLRCADAMASAEMEVTGS